MLHNSPLTLSRQGAEDCDKGIAVQEHVVEGIPNLGGINLQPKPNNSFTVCPGRPLVPRLVFPEDAVKKRVKGGGMSEAR